MANSKELSFPEEIVCSAEFGADGCIVPSDDAEEEIAAPQEKK